MESAVKDSLLAVICLCGKNFDVKYSAIHENGYEIIFDEEGKYLSECEAAESWDDSPTLRQMKISDEVEGSVNEVIDVLDKLVSRINSAEEESEYDIQYIDLWIDISAKAGRYIVNANDGQVMKED